MDNFGKSVFCKNHDIIFNATLLDFFIIYFSGIKFLAGVVDAVVVYSTNIPRCTCINVILFGTFENIPNGITLYLVRKVLLCGHLNVIPDNVLRTHIIGFHRPFWYI